MKRRLAPMLLALPLLLGVGRTLWLQPSQPFELPFQEVGLGFSRDARLLCFDAQRGARASSRAFGRRDEWSGAEQLTDVYLVDRQSADRQSAAVTLVSRGLQGLPANGSSYQAQLSRDGQRLVFCSEASNLVPDDRNGCQDVFVYAVATGQLRRLPSAEDRPGRSPSSLPSLNADGSLVACSTYGAGEVQRRLVVHWGAGRSEDLWGTPGELPLPTFGAASFGPAGDQVAFSRFNLPYGPGGRRPSAEIWAGVLIHPEGGNSMLSQRRRLSSRPDGDSPDGPSFSPCLAESACAFVSSATDLVPDDTNHRWDIFIHDQKVGVKRVSVGPAGREANEDSFDPSLSDDGRYVVFSSYASNLVDGDDNGCCDVFLHDRTLGTTSLIGPPGADGPSYNPVISGDGSQVAFASLASHREGKPGQIYVWERATGRLQRLAP